MTDLLATAERVVKTFISRDLTLCTAESLTGGLLGATVTEIPGASKVYLGGVVAYQTSMKTVMLDVDQAEIDVHTVVSPQVATMMAMGVQDQTNADWTVSVTGVAGPDKQEGHEPGEVWVTVLGPRIGALPPSVYSQDFHFSGDRRAIREQTVDSALQMLLRVISPV